MLSARVKTILWILVSVTATVLLPLIFFRPSESDGWDAMNMRLNEMKYEAAARRVPRSVLRGTPTPGNAWEQYDIAINGIANKAETAFILKHFSLGAQRSDGQLPHSLAEKDPHGRARSAYGAIIVDLAVTQAQAAVESGKPQDALDLVLDTLVFAKDISTNGDVFSTTHGLEIYSSVFNGVRYLLQSRKLTSNQVAELADKLKTVEKEFPDSETTLTNETMRIGFLLLESDEQGFDLVRRGEWRWAMSPRKTIAEAFRRRDEELQRIKAIDHMDFESAQQELGRIENESFAMRNTLVHESEINYGSFLFSRRKVLTHLRLLQAATTYLVSGQPNTIADPFGDKLFFRVDDKMLRIWSVGENTKNDSGSGDWFGELDMVIEVPRPQQRQVLAKEQ